jgi:hypothetical protein
MAETENFCHRVRTKGNWDVGRFRRVNFWAMSLKGMTQASGLGMTSSNCKPPVCASPQQSRGADVYLFYCEGQS